MGIVQINGRVLSAFGAELLKGCYAELLKPAEAKEYVTNDIPAEDGIEVYPMETKVKARTVSLIFLLTADSPSALLTNYQIFMRELMKGDAREAAGVCLLTIPDLEARYRLKYEACTSFDTFGLTAMKLAVTFTEAKPTNYATMTAEISEE